MNSLEQQRQDQALGAAWRRCVAATENGGIGIMSLPHDRWMATSGLYSQTARTALEALEDLERVLLAAREAVEA